MADSRHVVLIFTAADTDTDADAVAAAFAAIPRGPALPDIRLAWPRPRRALTPRQAAFAPREAVAFKQAEGRIAAENVAPYPPGVAVVAAGEVFDPFTLEYLSAIGYNNKDKLSVVAEPGLP
jgi:lysine decarboxylase